MRKVVLLLALWALPSSAQIPLPPAPGKFVTDAAGVLPADREHALNERLAEFERTSTHQVIVYVDRNVPQGTTLEEMGAEAIRTWGVGQVKRDNGAILFLFIDSRDSRIEVGYGLEGTLTDAKSKRILVEMRPLLRNGDYAGAVEQGAEAIIRTITPEPPAAVAPVAPVHTPQPVSEPANESFVAGCLTAACAGPLLLLLFVWLIVSMIRRGGSNVNRGTTWPTPPRRSNDDDSSPSSWSWGSSDSSSSSSSSWSSSDSSSSSSSDSSSSSSDFSGGGGSGGGGGASDKW